MRWMRFRIRTSVEAEDILVAAMEDIGLFGAQIEDNVPLTAQEKEQMFVDIPKEVGPDDGSALVSFFLEETDDGRLVLDLGEADNSAAYSGGSASSINRSDEASEVTPEEMRARIEARIAELRGFGCEIGDGTVTIEETADIDWENSWKQYFHQFWIDDILVLPSWEEPAVKEAVPAVTFHIDPGTAFGTGAHETTQLCIREIRRYLTDETVLLDVGTGSGILAILALMLGGKSAVGTDLDPCALPAVAENLDNNGVSRDRFRMILGNLVNSKETQDAVGYEQYDIVVANILPDVLVPLTPAAIRALRKGGYYITSGIVDGREHEVEEAMIANGLEHVATTTQGEWHCVVGLKN